MTGTIGRRVAGGLVGVAAMVVILAAAVALFFNPLYVGFEQDRAQAAAWTGYSSEEVHSVTNGVLGELYFGPARFEQAINGEPVFDPRERAHLADVRGVLLGFGIVTSLALIVLVVAALASHDRRWMWRGIGGGARLLAGAVVIGGAFFAVAFDAAFDLFHRLFFAGGSYTFDPSTERLVQLFPGQFWWETSIALAVVALLLSAAVWSFANGRLRAGTGLISATPVSAATGMPVAAKDSR
jgi:integral membrane protein (TIGR01906 family)